MMSELVEQRPEVSTKSVPSLVPADPARVVWSGKSLLAPGAVPMIVKPTSRFKLLSLDEIGSLPPTEWLVEGLIPTNALALLYGEPKLGKSFVALDMALSIAAGLPWLGRKVLPGDVIYVYAEGTSGLKLRTEAWVGRRGLKPVGFRALPTTIEVPSKLQRDELIAAIRAASLEPRLIVVDTLARNFGPGDENKQQDMNGFVAGCDGFRAAFPGATVLAIHHPGKDRKRGARGSLALLGAVDTAMVLRRVYNSDKLELITEAQKEAEPAQPVRLRLRPLNFGGGFASCVVEAAPTALNAVEPANTNVHPTRADERALAALDQLGESGATATEWEKASGIARSTFFQSRTRLVEAGKVLKRDDRYYPIARKSDPGLTEIQNVVSLDKAS